MKEEVAQLAERVGDYFHELWYDMYSFFIGSHIQGKDYYFEIPDALAPALTPDLVEQLLHRLHVQIVNTHDYFAQLLEAEVESAAVQAAEAEGQGGPPGGAGSPRSRLLQFGDKAIKRQAAHEARCKLIEKVMPLLHPQHLLSRVRAWAGLGLGVGPSHQEFISVGWAHRWGCRVGRHTVCVGGGGERSTLLNVFLGVFFGVTVFVSAHFMPWGCLGGWA